MSDYTTTPNLGLYKPNYALDVGQWGNHLNANADVLDAALEGGGPFLPLTGGTLGDGADAPTLKFNGAAGAVKGVHWQTAGANRWLLQTDASDNLALHAYDAVGAWKGQAIQFANDSSSIVTNFPLVANATNATSAGGITGISATATNTGSNAANGHRFVYNSSSNGNGFDIGLSMVSVFDPSPFVAGITAFYSAAWMLAVSPNDTTHNWAATTMEMNIANRGPDMGWKRDRFSARPTGVLLAVPELTAGQGNNATFAYSLGGSGGLAPSGFPLKFYNGFLIEPNAIAGLTGRGIYMTGDITGVASQFPYGPFQTEGTWLHGFDTTLATFVDKNALTMLAGQGVAWLAGTTSTPTAFCRDTAGTGTPEGVVAANVGSTYRRFDGAAGACFYVKESGTGNTGWVAK